MEESCTHLRVGDTVLKAELTTVPDARGIVIFASGSGSGRHSPRNRYMAEFLRTHASVSTLLVDLLATDELGSHETARRLAFDVGLLAERLVVVTDWALDVEKFDGPIGYFGASTGAAAALLASTQRREVMAVVSRGGRPDLAVGALEKVTAPTLFVAGREDRTVLDLNRTAHACLSGTSELLIVPGASYLFEEPRALEEVAKNASAWFERHLSVAPEHSEVRASFRR